MSAFRLIILTYLLGSGLFSYGITEAPVLLRACLSTNDTIVTIEFRNPNDACGSFVIHHVYGKEVGPTYSLMATESNFSANSIQFKLPNNNPTWSFFFETLYLCNGNDSISSNIITVDSERPMLSEIDSVSIDVATQKLIIGWSANLAPDLSGYVIYNYDNAGAILGDTSELNYFLPDHPPNQSIKIALAAFDSCALHSPISEIHSPMVLGKSYDPCSKILSLNWSSYIGWNTDYQKVYTSINGATFVLDSNNLLGNSYDFILNPGDSICSYVRAVKLGQNTTTSSSNMVCLKAPDVAIPKEVYLSFASVNSANQVEIEAYVENNSNSDSLVIYLVEGSVLSVVKEFKLNQGNDTYNTTHTTPTSSAPRTYEARTFDPCIGETGSTNTATTILLKLLNNSDLEWTAYGVWDGAVSDYTIMGFDGSTWNIVGNTTALNFNLGKAAFTCFKVVATENNNSYGWSSQSFSNVVCTVREPTFFVPNALNGSSENNTFRVIGTSIDLEKSSFILFDRWGGLIAESHQVDTGWSLAAEGKEIQTGVYFYVLTIYDLSGNKHRSSGSFRIIK
jgi:gliding motility-associated-like protein